MDAKTANIATAVLECLPIAAAVVDRSGKICFANSAATRTIEARDGIGACDGNLRMLCPVADRTLRECLTGSCGAVSNPIISVRRPSGEGVWLMKVKAALGTGGPTSAVVVSWLDAAAALPLRDGILEQLYSLSSAEVRVVTRLVNGESIPSVAAAMGIRQDTVRAHLKSAFRKTGAHRQSELVRLVILLSLFC